MVAIVVVVEEEVKEVEDPVAGVVRAPRFQSTMKSWRNTTMKWASLPRTSARLSGVR